MYRSNIYPKMILLVSFFVLALNSVFSQQALEFKLQLLEADKWGVYVRPNGINPSLLTQVAAAQVTVVMPNGFQWSGLQSVSGTWTANARIDGPAENPTKTYQSFGWVTEFPHVDLVAGEETLLFTFRRDEPCPDSIYLISNVDDPFLPPNSQNANVGNDMTVFDPIGGIYEYWRNYSPSAWSCHDCDGDGILNAFEDTDGDGTYIGTVEDINGNGILDPGEDLDNDLYLDPDVSQICNPCDPIHPESAAIELIGGADVICANDLGDTAWFKVTIEGGWPPYTVNYTNGTSNFAVNNYYSGDSIPFVPTASVTLDLVNIIDSFNCLLDTALTGGLNIEVHGPISIDDHPDNVTECFGNGTSFCIDTVNAGDGQTFIKWQVSTNGGGSWADLQNGSAYESTDDLCLSVINVAGKHNYRYRAKIFTSVCDTVYSNNALLQVEGPITISTQPRDTVNCATENVAFTAASANGGLVGTMSYVWQYSTDGSTWTNLANGAGPGGAVVGGATSNTALSAGSSTLTLTGITVAMDGYYYRLSVTTAECSVVYSNAARLNVEGTITVADHPDNISNCAGSEVNFVAGFSNAGTVYPSGNQTLTNYTWQISTNGGSTWANLTNTGVYNGITGVNVGASGADTLTITNVQGLDGYMYRIVYTSPTCGTPVISNAATLEVSGNVTFSDHPDDITVCSGGDTTFTATASIPQGTFSFAWEYSDDGGVTWDTIDFVGQAATFSHSNSATVASGTDVLTVINVANMYNRRFRARADATDCNSVYSNEARLTVQGPLYVTDQPDAVTECSGNATTFSATIANDGGNGSTIYRWQVSPSGSGGPWFDLSNNTIYNGTNAGNIATGTSTLSISNVAGLHGYCYRLSYRSSTCNIQYSSAACLTVEGPITVTAQPASVDLCNGDGASFTSTANVGTAGTLSYQWQVSSDNVSWSDIGAGTDGGVYSGFNTTTLNVSNSTNLYSRCYRLAFFTNECNRVLSNSACLNIDGPIYFTDMPDDIIQCSGEAILFCAVAVTDSEEADSLTQIQWNWQENTGGGWVDLQDDTLYNGVLTSCLSIAYTTAMDGNLYRAKIWTDNCDTVYSDPALIDVEGPITVTDEPDNIAECSGSGVSFQATVSLQNGDPLTLIYQWEVSVYDSTLGYLPWANISNDAIFSGATTTTLNVNNVAGMYHDRFRMRYRTPTCDAAWTNYAQLTVEGPISITDQPDAVVECSGNAANFCVETDNPGSGTMSYQWQVCVDGTPADGPWFNLSNNSIYNGTKTSCLSVSNVAGLNGYCYRVNIQTIECSIVSSDPACLTVEGPISFTDHPDDIVQCSGEGVTFAATSVIAVGNSGTMQYQWQWSSNGINYTDILAAGVNGFSGWDSPTLTVGNVVGINGRRFRLSVRTGECNFVYSFSALLTVEGPLTITAHPNDFTNCSDKEALFLTDVSNPGQGEVFSQWQYSANGGTTWQNIVALIDTLPTGEIVNFGGYDSDSLLVSPIEGLNGYLFRNIFWTESCNRDTTNEALLTVEGPITFTDQPDDVVLCWGQTAQFTIAIANSTGEGTVQYQWQVSTTSGSWTNLTNTAPYSGAFTNQLTITGVSNQYNYSYRCLVRTGQCDWEVSDAAKLFIEGPITISLNLPDTASICSNRPYYFNTTVSNPGYGQMTFRWQYSANSGATWTNFPTSNGSLVTTLGISNPTDPTAMWQGAFGQDLNLTNTDGLNGYMFRLTITMPNCSDITNDVVLVVRDKCLAGDCDLDNDGVNNNVDTDDDNDQVSDYWEQWMTDNNTIVATTEFPGTGPWNYTVDGTGNFPASPYISYNRCLTDTDGDFINDNQEDPDGDNINNGEETDGDITFDGNPLDPCHPILGPTCIGINLAIRVNLQGARIGQPNSDTLMRATLRAYGAVPSGPNQNPGQRLIPTAEPYTAIEMSNGTHPFVHIGPDGGGDEQLTTLGADSVFDATGASAIVDWVFVELRSSTALDSVATTRAALLQADGDVVDLDGEDYLRFPNADAGTYYVAVRHRNHLGVMTAEALDLSPALQVVDFTDEATLTNGTNAQVKINGRMYMWAGDLNSDGRTVYQGPGNDILKLFTTVLFDQNNTTQIANFITQGYREADVNLDGRSIYQGPLNDRSILLLNTILSHPANVGLISNFVILEMLP